MKLAGTLSIGNEQYFLFVNYKKQQEQYFCYTKMRGTDYLKALKGDLDGVEVLRRPEDLYSVDASEYLVGALARSRATGKLKSYKNTNQVQIFLNTVQEARLYCFKEEDVFLKDFSNDVGCEIEQFGAEDASMQCLYVLKDGVYSELKVKHGDISIDLRETKRVPSILVAFQEVAQQEQRMISRATVDKVTYEMLAQVLDMSWYRDEEKVKKVYRPVCSITEFEEMFGTMMHDLSETDGKFYVALDTETTGLNIFNLSKDNPLHDHCVAISISWRKDEAWVVFTDMEYVNSLPNEYAFRRLEEVFQRFKGRREIAYQYCGKACTVSLERDKVNLVGYNFSFDRRVSYGEGADLWFDDDALQMGFCINPTTVRGSNKLKTVTRILFHHETPELEDVLGRGNEDKFRYLSDVEVACIYAGADADYTLQCFFVLKEMMGKRMYLMYKRQDVKLLNILAISEYNGMNTKEEEVLSLAERVRGNIRILEDIAYRYVGAYMDYQQKVSVLYGQHEAGMITEDELFKALEGVHPDPDAVYEFEFKGAEIRSVLYDILKYPVLCTTDKGVPKIDKYARMKLLRVKRKGNSTARKLNRSVLKSGCEYSEYLKLLRGTEADRKKAKSMELINVDAFNEKEYPFAMILEQHALYTKEYTAYYKPMCETNMEGRMFKTYSMARIETRRIMNPGQTVKKDLKKLIVPYSDEYYLLDFDMSQVEYRIMASLAGAKELVKKMQDPEKDYHIETAAMLNRILAYLISREQRKKAKKVSFGQPYGLGIYSLTEDMYGEVNEETKFETSMIVHKWSEANHEIVDFLERNRDMALEEVELPKRKRDFMDAWQRDEQSGEYVLDQYGCRVPKPIGAVYNGMGFCRYFDLSGVDQSKAAIARRREGKYTQKEGVIRRAAGNYPIQSFAAELFRIILCRFYDRCEKEGISDKVKWHMLIHDELLCSVHKSVNPFYLYKIVKEACMITLPGHTNYFVGINIGNTWAECKDDAREAPVHFVERMIAKYDSGELREKEWFDDPWEDIRPLREQYIRERIHEVLLAIQPDLDAAPINLPLIFEKFENYTVRAYVNDYPKNREIPADTLEDDKDDAIYVSRFESWVLEVFGDGKEMIGLDGVKYCVTAGEQMTAEEDFLDFMAEEDSDLPDDGYYYDYDEGVIVDTYYAQQEEVVESTFDDIEFNYAGSANCRDVAAMTITERRYRNLKILNHNLVVTVDNDVQLHYLKGMIQASRNGVYTMVFAVKGKPPMRWGKVSDKMDLSELDCIVTSIRDLPKCQVVSNRMLVRLERAEQAPMLKSFILHNPGDGYHVFAKNNLGVVTFMGRICANADFAKMREIVGG